MDTLLTRGIAKVIPEDLAKEKLKSGKKLRVYNGIDPTGTKLHLGHTIPLRKLSQFAKAGHHVILLIGSFTATVGDPSGRGDMRNALTREQVKENLRTYKKQASKILDFTKVELVFNHEWWDKIPTSEFLRIASHFTKQQMEQRDMFVRREAEGKPIYFHELTYPILQGYDSVHLDVDCEIGATEQEFNMLAGRTLQKAYRKREKFILTLPILEGTDGRKMSKTYNNCIYLEDGPNDMYGKLMSIKDELTKTYIECCTDLPLDQCPPNPRDAKALLAREIVRMYHSKKAADAAAEEFDRVFKGGGLPDDIPGVSVKAKTLLVDVMVHHNLASSKSEARRLIKQRGVKLNEKTVDSLDTQVEEGILKVGKRKFLRLKT